jgi:hypothetical protein
MKRMNMHFPVRLREALEARSEETGAPVAEIVRRACVDYLVGKPSLSDWTCPKAECRATNSADRLRCIACNGKKP